MILVYYFGLYRDLNCEVVEYLESPSVGHC